MIGWPFSEAGISNQPRKLDELLRPTDSRVPLLNVQTRASYMREYRARITKDVT